MPVTFVFAIIFAVVTLIAGVVARGFRKGQENLAYSASMRDDYRLGKVWSYVIGGLFGFGTACLLIASSFNSVGTYDEGVTTSFGKVLSYDGPGPHWIAPWENMAVMDEAVQSSDYTTTVRLAQQQTANASIHLRWQILPAA